MRGEGKWNFFFFLVGKEGKLKYNGNLTITKKFDRWKEKLRIGLVMYEEIHLHSKVNIIYTGSIHKTNVHIHLSIQSPIQHVSIDKYVNT